MSAQPSLAPAGSSTYSSNTMFVGDGTWDSRDNTFLLPNVQGLNFATMRYNGMGNRFRNLEGYYSLTVAHGTLAAITFLVIVPTAILVPAYYHRNPRLALRVHIGLQVLTVLLTTVIFVLGYFAVGPERSLTNPHHGIGLAIFILILFQAIFGWLVKKIEKGKMRTYIPIKLMLHQWLGRAIALLAFAQIPIGLTLYGSPASLFVLYTLWMFFLLVLLFVLVHRNHKRVALAFEHGVTGASYVSGARSEYTDGAYDEKHHPRLERAAEAIGLAGALGALRRRTSGRYNQRADMSDMASTLPPSQVPGQSHMTRFTESDVLSEQTKQHTWRNRIIGAGAGLGAAAAAKKLFSRKREREDDDYDDPGPYRGRPLGGAVPTSSEAFNNIEEGRPADHWQQVENRERAQQAAMSGGAGVGHQFDSRISEDYSSVGPEKPSSVNKWGLPAAGALAGLGGFFKRRKSRKEDGRVAAERQNDQEEERLFTSPGGRPRYTGDGTPRRGNAPIGYDSPYPETPTRPPIRSQAQQTPGQYRDDVAQSQMSPPPPANIPPPPRATNLPPPPPVHSSPRSTAQGSPSDPYRRRGGGYSSRPSSMDSPGSPTRSGPRHPPEGIGSSVLSPPRPPYARGPGSGRSQSNSPHSQGVDSPPVSVKVKMSNNGRHVTLRRLNEEEAARERQSRGSDTTEVPSSYRREQTPIARPPTSAGQQTSEMHLAPGDPGMGSASAEAPLTSSPYETGTDVTDFDSNRRRRRAERARAEQARQGQGRRPGGGTGHVEFT